ncbi:hypothetical protein SAMN06265348_1077 [Pedobacter westerhofensis]|uniref:Outer membrane protein beta-barrel domain-containing protein n=1 Tax=Pedobacter westerhofensis TaxID=425512 RepID=A0A521E476_9SPHI|nr:hypothetical protein [Pedobacter westerhofensis]SMO78743.1 hypothetical protein SAMN06265348_1077 [Pedobacter westerhofensis]
MKHKLLLFIILCLQSGLVIAQEQANSKTENIPAESAPVPIELFAGNKGFAFQLIVSKQFSAGSKFGFFNVTNFAGDYKQTNQTTSFLSQSFVTAEIWKGISAATGISAIGSSTTPLEVRPTAGLQYLLASRDILLVVIPRFDLSQTYNFETFAVLEYKPMLSKNWGIYTRLQGLYNYNTKLGYHEISEINLRLGLAYKSFQFGLASIHDFYGPEAINVNNYGLFIKTNIF